MDYIITDIVTSPIELASQYSEKLAYMPHSYLIGDHKHMFSHLCERIILTEKICRFKKKYVPDNVAILNGIDLSPIIEKTYIEEEEYVINSEITGLKLSETTKITLKVAKLYNYDQIEVIKKKMKSINFAILIHYF